MFAGFATITHFTLGLAYCKAEACSTNIFLFFCNKSLRYIPFFLGKPPINTITSAFLNIYFGLSPDSRDLQSGNAQSFIYIITPFITLFIAAISKSFKFILLFPKTLPFNNNGINEYAI